LKPGDVVLTEGGDFDKLGRGFIWHDQVPECLHQNHIFAVRANPDMISPEFLAYLIQSHRGKAYFLSVAHRTTNLASINSTKLKAFPLVVPTLSEQEAIVDMLQACDKKLETLYLEDRRLTELFGALLTDLMAGTLQAYSA
jgi:type I restriction enzyme S subunit